MREPRPGQLPATLDDANAVEMQRYVRDRLRAARGDGVDPFDDDVMHAAVRQILKAIAMECEPNAAFVVKLAIVETEDAHEALVELINERNIRGEPLGPALVTYNSIALDRAPRARPPEGRQRNFLADFVIVCLILDLKAQFPVKLRRGPTSKRPCAFSVVAGALRAEGLGRGGEEAIRKVWERYGPPAIPTHRRGPKPGVVRFTFAS